MPRSRLGRFRASIWGGDRSSNSLGRSCADLFRGARRCLREGESPMLAFAWDCLVCMGTCVMPCVADQDPAIRGTLRMQAGSIRLLTPKTHFWRNRSELAYGIPSASHGAAHGSHTASTTVYALERVMRRLLEGFSGKASSPLIRISPCRRAFEFSSKRRALSSAARVPMTQPDRKKQRGLGNASNSSRLRARSLGLRRDFLLWRWWTYYRGIRRECQACRACGSRSWRDPQ